MQASRKAILERDESQSSSKDANGSETGSIDPYPVLQRARNALAHRASSSNFVGFNLLLEFDVHYSVIHNVPTSNRVVTWYRLVSMHSPFYCISNLGGVHGIRVPSHQQQHSPLFLLLYMKSENMHATINEHAPAPSACLELATDECPQPGLVCPMPPQNANHTETNRARRTAYTVIYMQHGRICWQGREFTLLGRDAPANTCLLCAYSDEAMQVNRNAEARSRKVCTVREATRLGRCP